MKWIVLLGYAGLVTLLYMAYRKWAAPKEQQEPKDETPKESHEQPSEVEVSHTDLLLYADKIEKLTEDDKKRLFSALESSKASIPQEIFDTLAHVDEEEAPTSNDILNGFYGELSTGRAGEKEDSDVPNNVERLEDYRKSKQEAV